MTKSRSYTELVELRSFEERFRYLSLKGVVGEVTFGSERYKNQDFYHSNMWRQLRTHVIIRDSGCDLGIEGRDIVKIAHIHHMNPMTLQQVVHGEEVIWDPEFLITTLPRTHRAIHYGDERHLPRPFVERRPGDTDLW